MVSTLKFFVFYVDVAFVGIPGTLATLTTQIGANNAGAFGLQHFIKHISAPATH